MEFLRFIEVLFNQVPDVSKEVQALLQYMTEQLFSNKNGITLYILYKAGNKYVKGMGIFYICHLTQSFTNVSTIVLYILIFKFIERSREDKNVCTE